MKPTAANQAAHYVSAWLRARQADEIEHPDGLNAWNDFAQDVCRQGLAGVVLEIAARHSVDLPSSVRDRLRDAAAAIAVFNLHLTHELVGVLDAFARADVSVMLLKGAALLPTVYGHPALRRMTDVDLLVRPRDVERSIRLLSECGCRRGFDLLREDFFPTFYHEMEWWTASPQPVRIDLHARPFRPLRVSRTMPDEAIWDGARTVRIGEAKAWMPRPEAMFIHLAAHAAFHGCGRLIWLYDLQRFVEAQADRLDWELVERRCEEWRLSLAVRRAVEQAEEILGPIVPASVMVRPGAHPDGGGMLSRAAGKHESPKPSAWLPGPSPVKPCHPVALRCSWRDRLVLWQAPRDAASPLMHILVDLLCTPGLAFRARYLRALLLPGRAHLASLYPFRHRGWVACAHAWRSIRLLGRWGRILSPSARTGG